MATKGIVAINNYSFSAANKTIVFSNEYIGMSLADITYITNIKDGVATVIYDPFDPLKGGVLNGLTLGLSFDTTLMSDSDPLQIIVGFSSASVQPNISGESNNDVDQTALLEQIAASLEQLAESQDVGEQMPIFTNDKSILKDPATGAVQTAIVDGTNVQFSSLKNAGDYYEWDTSGYQSLYVSVYTGSAWSAALRVEGRNSSSVGLYAITNWAVGTNNQTKYILQDSALHNASGSTTYLYCIPCTFRYIRITVVVTGQSSVLLSGILKNNPNTFIGINASPVNITTLGGGVPSYIGSNSQGGQTSTTGGIYVSGNAAPGSNVVGFPIMVGGREAPYTGNLSGIQRTLLTDPSGRLILGTGYGSTPQNTAPQTGVGGVQNNMYGAQSLTVADANQQDGDNNVMLLKQILQELKILNQQFIEIPFLLNAGQTIMSEPEEYRNDKTSLF